MPLLHERSRRGFVRRIHGDLHLGNIVLIDGKPVLFDAIEFSDIIASGDVFYDLAFLLMDLLERGLAFAAKWCSTDTSRSPAGSKTSKPSRRCPSSCRCGCDPRQGNRGAPGAGESIRQAAIARRRGRILISRGRRLHRRPPKFVAVGGLSGTGKTSSRERWRRN